LGITDHSQYLMIWVTPSIEFPFHCSKWLGQIDRQNLYMMTKSKMMFCTMTLPTGDVSMASVMLHVSWSYGHFGTWRMFTTAMAFWDNDLRAYNCAWNYIFWHVPFCFF
jgi:hypothetical protein